MTIFTDDEVVRLVQRLAHIVRNPLATIKGGVQLVQYISQPEGEVADYLASAASEVDRIDLIMRDVQRYVRLARPVPSEVDMADLLHQVTLEAGQSAAYRKVTLRSVVEGPPSCRVDRDQVLLALCELVENAVRASPEGGEVEICARSAGEWLELTVADRGAGIGADLADRVLDPFFTSTSSGTGLGLNIADKVAALGGGRLEWAGRSGGGCVVALRLPLSSG